MTKQTRETIDRKGQERSYTDEGFLVVPSRIARTGIQEYRAMELGIEDGDPLRIIRVYRPPEEVFSQASMQSFENKPITNDHPNVMVDSSNWKDLAKGFARNVRRDGNFLVADLIVTDQAAIDAIVGGKVELSNGYMCDYVWGAGTTPDGEAYDAKQTNIRGNHVAIVDAARCGPACRVSDSQTQPKGKPMADRKVTIDGIPFDLPEAAAAAVEKLVADRAAAQEASKKAAEALAAAQASHDAALKAKDAELEKAKKDVMTPEMRDAMVATWAKTIDDAKRLVPAYDTKGKTCDAIRREVLAECAKDAARKPIIDAALAGRDLATVDSETVKTAFAVLAASAPAAASQARDASTDSVAAALAAAGKATTDAAAAEPVGRDAMLKRFQALSDGKQ